MNQQHTIRLSSWARLVGLALLLGVGVLASLGLASRTAHAQSLNTLTVTNCSTDSQLQADVSTANTDNANDTITFACSGAIPLTSTLTISGSMTLDGSGQTVTLDGQHQRRVLFVNGGVTLTLKTLTIANGQASTASNDVGGGILNGGTLSISNSTVSGNSASDDGGGIANGGTASISNSTVSGNSASNIGGGIANFGTASISNSTVSGNSAPGGHGGGIINEGFVNIGGSIVAANTGGDCNNQVGSLTDQGYNLSSDSSCGFTGTGSLQNTDPHLAALAANGGPTQTLALLDGSPAIDLIPAAQCLATDQRGATRPDDSETTCDIGAYESAYVDNDLRLTNMPTNITTDATSPQGAVVTYSPPTAMDESGDNPAPSVNCSPASGTTFAIGTTTVTCTATDSDDTNSPVRGSFQVVVKGAAAQVNDLISLVNSFHLSSSLQTSLDNKLKDVLTAINAGQTTTACSELTDFIGHVQAQIGKGLTTAQSNQLIAAAKQVQAVLGC